MTVFRFYQSDILCCNRFQDQDPLYKGFQLPRGGASEQNYRSAALSLALLFLVVLMKEQNATQQSLLKIII